MPEPLAPRILAEGRFLRLLAGSGWEWVERVNASGAAVIAAVTEDRQLVLVEQYRVPMGQRVIDLPAGLVGDEPGGADEPMIEAARRELFEETGYEADQLRRVVSGPASPGLTTEVYTLFLALGARHVGRGGGVASERIQVHVVPLAEVEAWLDRRREEGMMIDPKIYLGLYFIAKAV
jgi:ADP-ribose pyrophosphatase